MRFHPTPRVLPPLEILQPCTERPSPHLNTPVEAETHPTSPPPTTNPPKATPDAIPPGSRKRRMIPGGWFRLQRPSSAHPLSAARADSTSSHASPTVPSSPELTEDYRKRPRNRTNDAAELPTVRDDGVHAKRAKHVRTEDAHSL
jgi:hypothetical protein